MGRRLRTDVPQAPSTFKPSWPHLNGFEEKDKLYKQQQKDNFDRRHHTRSLPELPPDTVWISVQGRQEQERIVTSASTPRSYIVETPAGYIRRNRVAIIPQPTSSETTVKDNSESAITRRITRSQTGTPVLPPERLSYPRKGDVA